MLSSQGYIIWSSIGLCNCDEPPYTPSDDSQTFADSPAMDYNGSLSSPCIEEKGLCNDFFLCTN